MKKVFIDGAAGTTGLRIHDRLSARKDIEVVVLSDEFRKDVSARREALNSVDVAILCLPDDAARESASLVENPDVALIDTSTAHRTDEAWEYGFPELAARREKIRASKRIANPGCHASVFIALVDPLVRAGVISRESELCAFSLTGYSGGGKKMIAEYDEKLQQDDKLFLGGRQYALSQAHKHLPEMMKVCNLAKAPVFSPIIVPHYSGMETSVLLHSSLVKGGIAAIEEVFSSSYANNGLVEFARASELEQPLSSAMLSGSDKMIVTVHGNDERIVVTSLFDNLGKGASGAAIQNMNIVIGAEETEGLVK